MNAEPLLARVAQLLSKHRLDAVLIGNAAAALQGSPVPGDLDFMFRKPPASAKAPSIADAWRRGHAPFSCIRSVAVCETVIGFSSTS